MIRKFLFFASIIVLLSSCECPPGADTPRQIKPTEFAKVNFFNGVYSGTSFELQTYFGYLLPKLYFGKYSNYVDVASGSNVLNLLNKNEKFFSIPINLTKDKSYTIPIFGNNSSDISMMMIHDDIENISSRKSYIRYVNAFKFDIPVGVHLSFESDTTNVNFFNYTNYKEVTSDGFVEIYFEGKRIFNILFDPKPGFLYTLITYYSPDSRLNERGIAADIIEVKP